MSDSSPTANPLAEAELPEIEHKQPLRSIEEVQPEKLNFPDEFATPSDFTSENESQDVLVEFPVATEQLVEEVELTEDKEITSSTAIDDIPLKSMSSKEATRLEEDSLAVEPTKKARKPLKQPLLPQYEHLSKSEAIEKLLQEEAGNILHIDDIVRYLCGELETPAFKAEKNRLYNTLNQGTENGLWDKVPGRSGCYTIVLEQAIKKPDSKQPINKQQEISALALLEALPPAYSGLKLTQVVEKVLQGNPGVAMNSEKIAQILFDEAEEDIFAAAKSKIGKVLWSGANQRRWQGVPGKLGVYTVSREK